MSLTTALCKGFDLTRKPLLSLLNCIAEPKRDVRDNLGLRRGQRCLPFNKYEPTYRPVHFLLSQFYHDFIQFLSRYNWDKTWKNMGKSGFFNFISILYRFYPYFLTKLILSKFYPDIDNIFLIIDLSRFYPTLI